MPAVTARFQGILTSEAIRDTIMGRAKLKAELIEALTDFHKQDMIKPSQHD
jgi:hypothetical protein